jgi:hypothetical protein
MERSIAADCTGGLSLLPTDLNLMVSPGYAIVYLNTWMATRSKNPNCDTTAKRHS